MKATNDIRGLLLLAASLCVFAVVGQTVPQTEIPWQDYANLKAHGELPLNVRPTEVHLDQHALDSIIAANGGWQRGGGNGGLCGLYQDPTGCPLSQGPWDDGSSAQISLPFSFDLYGTTYNSLWINNNGNVTFDGPYGTFSAAAFPNSTYVMVAPFWGDVDTGGQNGGQVLYCLSDHALFVNWVGVGYFPQMTDKRNTFQLIITDATDAYIGVGNNVAFSYLDMQWTTGSASGGVNGFGGIPAVVGANLGDGIGYISIGKFDHAGTDYAGPNGNSGVSWLDYKDFVFSTLFPSANISPIVEGNFVCDTIVLCTGVAQDIEVNFLAPENDQIITPTFSAPDFPQFNPTLTSGVNGTIAGNLVPNMGNLGFHTITFTGTDNGTPNLSQTASVVVQVIASPDLGNSAAVYCDTDAPVDMLTLLGGNPIPGGTWTDTLTNDTVSNIFTPGTSADTPYRYSVDNGGGCAAQAILTISTVPHADAGMDTSLAYCSWDFPDILFQYIPGTPQNGGSWQSPTGVTFNGTLNPGSMFPGTYKYIIAGNAPCVNDTAFIQIAIPQAVNAGQDSSIVLCRDAAPISLQSMLAGTPQATGTWADVNGAIVPDVFDPATGTIGVYTYTVPAVLPCPTLSAVLTVNLDLLPIAGLDSSLVICANGGDTPLFPLLGGTPDVGGHWLSPLDSAVANGILDPSKEISGNYRYVAIGPGTCAHLSDTAIVNVHIDPLPVITFTANPDSGCAPLEVTFTNTTDPIYVGNTCVWDPGDGTGTVDTCTSFTHLYTTPGWYHVKLKVTTPEGCTDQLIAPGKVLVDPPPVATYVYTPDPPTAGNNNVVFSGTDPHAVEFFWTLPDFSQEAGHQVGYAFPDKIAGDYTVCLSVRDRYGCADTLCDTIHVFVDNLWVPTAFTPDGNGVNDVFRPITTDMAPEDYHLRIFDRWGQMIFETTDPVKGWDGSGKGGGKANTGVYVWRLEYRPLFTADKLDAFGQVTLLR